MRVLVLAGAALLAASAVVAAPRGPDDVQPVSREAILAAMRQSYGYSLTATANGPRLQAEVLLRLIRAAEATDPASHPLWIGHQEWFEAYLERTGLTPQDAPLYVRLAHEVGQDMLADYRRERVVEEVLRGPEPLTLANVHIFWPEAAGKPESYSYDDTLSNPKLHVTQKRDILYRLVDYGDRIWYADVRGLRGRPTSGALGLLFDIIGEAQVLESRSAFAPDGIQIVRGHGRKLLVNRTATVTIWPDGHADKGVPQGRPDLEALEARLEEPLEIRFRPLDGDGDP